MFGFRITEVVKHLIIINFLAYIASWIILGESRGILAMAYPTRADFQAFQVVTHMFMHADEGHLFFNMLGLFFFGPFLESLWGPKRFLFYYLFSGFGALVTHLIVNFIEIQYFGGYPGGIWGASGAVFGVLIGVALKFPNTTVQLIIPPIPIQMKHLAPIYIGLELFMGLSSFNTGVAHFAHLGGALFGFLLISYWDKYGSKL